MDFTLHKCAVLVKAIGLCSLLTIQMLIFGQDESVSESKSAISDHLMDSLPPLTQSERQIRDELISIRKSMEARGKRSGTGKPLLDRAEFNRIRRLEKSAKTDEDRQVMRYWLVGDFDLENPPDEPIWDIEEVVVIGRQFSFKHIPDDPKEFSVAQIHEMRGIRKIANELYGQGRYGKAFPILLELAKRGFKDSQSRIAYILFDGADGVEKSNLRAMGWLGAAAHGRTEPGFRVLFNKYNRQIPKESRAIVDRVVAGYQERYSHSEYLNCSTDHPHASGVVKRVYCRFKLEAIAEACKGRCWAHTVNVEQNGVDIY